MSTPSQAFNPVDKTPNCDLQPLDNSSENEQNPGNTTNGKSSITIPNHFKTSPGTVISSVHRNIEMANSLSSAGLLSLAQGAVLSYLLYLDEDFSIEKSQYHQLYNV